MHFALCDALETDAEIDEDDEAESACDGIDRSAHCEGVVNAVCKYGCKEDLEGIEGCAADEMIHGVIIAHHDGEGIVSGDSQERTHDRDRNPLVSCLNDI